MGMTQNNEQSLQNGAYMKTTISIFFSYSSIMLHLLLRHYHQILLA
ncbi:hypothetical protein Vspart_01032 [Vibrio spartinae]|uniref:Uncharacterized protein n=1 Tax=Vibrio spartinae TaxID=1918945 RepID=A0ABX6QXP0_9VIBR|nr:hypothetical protein Vspart_01032 [Vibrio spartinae]